MRAQKDFLKNLLRHSTLNANGTDAHIASVPPFENKTVSVSVSSMLARTVLSDEAEHMSRDVTNLNLVATFGDSIPAMVAIDVLELLVARITPTAMHLHRPIRSIADQVVAFVVAHRNLVGEIELDFRPR